MRKLITPAAAARVTAPLDQAWTLPPVAYTHPDIFSAEQTHLFSKDWICLGRVEQVPNPGDYLCTDFMHQPIVIARDLSGELHALSSICLHRAMPVAQGCGNTTRFVCPYHHWTYELDGQLRSAPMMDGLTGFEPEHCHLPKLQLEVWHGFIFVNADPQATPLANQVSGLDQFIKDYEFENLEVVETLYFDSPWNWKILVENFMEAYHHIGPHQNTFEPVYPARDSSVPDNQGQPWAFLRMPGLPPPDTDISSFPNLPNERRHELFAACIFPIFLFAASNTTGVWYQLEPKGADAMDLHIHALLHKEFVPHLDDNTREEIRTSLTTIHQEDIAVNAGPWQGLQANLTQQGRLSIFEKAIWQMNQHWADRMGVKART